LPTVFGVVLKSLRFVGAVDPTQMQSKARRTPLQDVELMPQYQDFGFQPRSRLEAVAQHTDQQKADCNHSAIMF
jgi:hypothetical protein